MRISVAFRIPGFGPALSAVCAAAWLAGCHAIPVTSHMDMPGLGRPEYAGAAEVPLDEKATRFEAILEQFIAKEGHLVYRQPALGEFAYSVQADEPIWTGTILGAEAMRYHVTKDPVALERVVHLLEGLHALHTVTGVRGLWARSFWPAGSLDPEDRRARVASPPLGEGYRYRGDVSKDQMCGVLFGLALTYKLVDDPRVRAIVREDAAAFADHLIKNNLTLRDIDGNVTTYGNVNGRIAGVPIGLNSAIALTAMKLAHHTTGKKRYREEYEALIARGYLDHFYWSKFQVFGMTNHNNDNMQMLVSAALWEIEPDARVRAAIAKGLERTFHYVRLEGNSWFSYACMAVIGFDRQAARDAHLQLVNFPFERRRLPVDLRGDPRFPRGAQDARRNRERCEFAIPVHYRCMTSNVWKSCPYVLLQTGSEDDTTVTAPIDYLLAYYAGRYWGFIE